MNKLYDIAISVRSRKKFTKEALSLIENNITDVVLTTETEQEFADSIAEDIKALNNGHIDGVEITMTCKENLPYTTFSYNSKSTDTVSFSRDGFHELKVLAKFCWNVIDEQLFIQMMAERYNDVYYIKEKWPEFKRNSIMFIIGRDERELYSNILEEIKRTGYNG